jgi:hypothetical protein
MRIGKLLPKLNQKIKTVHNTVVKCYNQQQMKYELQKTTSKIKISASKFRKEREEKRLKTHYKKISPIN